MPVAYQSLEMAQGQTIVYNMASRRSSFTVTEIPKGSNCHTFRFQDSLSRGLAGGAESPHGSSYRMPSPQDSVVQDFLTLSLHGQLRTEVGSISEETEPTCIGKSSGAFPSLNTCLYQGSAESAPSSACGEPLGSLTLGSISANEACSQEDVSSISHTDLECSFHGSTLTTASILSPTLSTDNSLPMIPHSKNGSGKCDGFYSYQQNLCGFNSLSNATSNGVRHEGVLSSGHDELEPYTSLDSSLSSENDMLLESSSSCGEASQLLDETEAQSALKGSSSITASPPTRKGLSRFYAGKSQSFSCVRDVVSVKDLAKPEHGCSKKRRMGSSGDRTRFSPLPKGPASPFKKPPNGAKSSLALAVAMSAKDEQESQFPLGCLGGHRSKNGIVPSRSYSLSDLQGAARSIFFIG